MVCIHTENQNQAGFCPYTLPVVSVHGEPTLGHSRCILKNVPPQSNSPFDTVIGRAIPQQYFYHHGKVNGHTFKKPAATHQRTPTQLPMLTYANMQQPILMLTHNSRIQSGNSQLSSIDPNHLAVTPSNLSQP